VTIDNSYRQLMKTCWWRVVKFRLILSHPPAIKIRPSISVVAVCPARAFGHLSAVAPFSSLRIINFGRLDRCAPAYGLPPATKNLAVGQKRSGMKDPVFTQFAGRAEFSAGRSYTSATTGPPRRSGPAVFENRRGLTVTALRHFAGLFESIRNSIEQFCAALSAADYEDFSVPQDYCTRFVTRIVGFGGCGETTPTSDRKAPKKRVSKASLDLRKRPAEPARYRPLQRLESRRRASDSGTSIAA